MEGSTELRPRHLQAPPLSLPCFSVAVQACTDTVHSRHSILHTRLLCLWPNRKPVLADSLSAPMSGWFPVPYTLSPGSSGNYLAQPGPAAKVMVQVSPFPPARPKRALSVQSSCLHCPVFLEATLNGTPRLETTSVFSFRRLKATQRCTQEANSLHLATVLSANYPTGSSSSLALTWFCSVATAISQGHHRVSGWNSSHGKRAPSLWCK